MYAGQDFDPIEPGETDIFTFEFTEDLPAGRTASAPVFTCSVSKTDARAVPDTSPASRIAGNANITTKTNAVTGITQTFVNQKITGMLVGNKYILEAQVTTSDGCTLKQYSHVYCTPLI